MYKISRQTFLILLLALAPALCAGFLHPRRPAWGETPLAQGEVLVSTAKEWGDQVLWIDARKQDLYEKEHIPGALLLNEDEWDDLLVKILPEWNPGRRVVVYCGGETCQPSHDVAERLRNQVGWKEVYVLKGGWEAWQNQAK